MRERGDVGRLPKVPSGDARMRCYLYVGALAGLIRVRKVLGALSFD